MPALSAPASPLQLFLAACVRGALESKSAMGSVACGMQRADAIQHTTENGLNKQQAGMRQVEHHSAEHVSVLCTRRRADCAGGCGGFRRRVAAARALAGPPAARLCSRIRSAARRGGTLLHAGPARRMPHTMCLATSQPRVHSDLIQQSSACNDFVRIRAPLVLIVLSCSPAQCDRRLCV